MFKFFKRWLRRRKLNSIDIKKIPPLYDVNKKIYGKVINVYDGDTITVLYLFKNKIPMKIKLRIIGIDTPEIKGEGEERKAAELIRDDIKRLILGKFFYFIMYKFDKYGGRILGDLYIKKNLTLSDYIIVNGYGKKYTGKKKENWNKKELKEIVAKFNRNKSINI